METMSWLVHFHFEPKLCSDRLHTRLHCIVGVFYVKLIQHGCQIEISTEKVYEVFCGYSLDYTISYWVAQLGPIWTLLLGIKWTTKQGSIVLSNRNRNFYWESLWSVLWLSWISLPWLLASFTLKDMDPCALTDLGSLPESVCHLKTVLTTTWLRRKYFLKNIYYIKNKSAICKT